MKYYVLSTVETRVVRCEYAVEAASVDEARKVLSSRLGALAHEVEVLDEQVVKKSIVISDQYDVKDDDDEDDSASEERWMEERGELFDKALYESHLCPWMRHRPRPISARLVKPYEITVDRSTYTIPAGSDIQVIRVGASNAAVLLALEDTPMQLLRFNLDEGRHPLIYPVSPEDEPAPCYEEVE